MIFPEGTRTTPGQPLRLQRGADPLLDLKLLRSRSFSAALGVNIIACFVSFGPFVFIAQYLQLVLGLSPLHNFATGKRVRVLTSAALDRLYSGKSACNLFTKSGS